MTDPTPPKTFPSIQGRCPACRGDSLFIGTGGWITCSRIDCPNPSAASQIIGEIADARQHGAFTFCEQQVAHVNMTAFARKIAEKREAIGQRAEAVQYANEQKQRAEQAEELLRIAHDTSNKSETERARAVQRAEMAEPLLNDYRAALTRAEAERDQLRETAGAALGHARADRAALIEARMRERARQAAIERVRKALAVRLADDECGEQERRGYHSALIDVGRALDDGDEPAPTGPAATQPADRTAQSGVDTPGCTCGHTGKGLAWHDTTCPWRHAWDDSQLADQTRGDDEEQP